MTDANSPDYQDLSTAKRQLEKDIEVYKARLTVEERDKIKLQGQISVLDSQVKRYRGQVQSSVRDLRFLVNLLFPNCKQQQILRFCVQLPW